MEVNPNIALSDSLRKELYGDNLIVLRIKADMVDQTDYQKIMDMYKDRWMPATCIHFVGNIDQATATPLIEQYLGSLPSINRKEDFRDVNLDIRKGEHKNVFHRELQTQKAIVCIITSGECEYTLKEPADDDMLSQLPQWNIRNRT